jgi:hypothetical protein
MNLGTTMSATTILDLAAGPGEAAKSALVMKRPYWGLCLSEQHVTVLYRHLVHWVLSEMGSKGSPLFNPTYAECTGLSTETGDGMPTTPDRKRKTDQETERKHIRNAQSNKRPCGSHSKQRDTSKALSRSSSSSGSDAG